MFFERTWLEVWRAMYEVCGMDISCGQVTNCRSRNNNKSFYFSWSLCSSPWIVHSYALFCFSYSSSSFEPLQIVTFVSAVVVVRRERSNNKTEWNWWGINLIANIESSHKKVCFFSFDSAIIVL